MAIASVLFLVAIVAAVGVMIWMLKELEGE